MAEFSDNPSSTDTSTRSGQNLVEDVLREAQALLAGTEGPEGGRTASESETAAEVEPSGEVVDLQSLVDRVDTLLGDLGHLAEEIAAGESSTPPGLDLTLVLPPKTPVAEHIVPDLGSAGPQVDLFATPVTESESAEARETMPPPAPVVLETEMSAVSSDPGESAGSDSMLDDLAAALAEEFDQPRLAGSTESSSPAAAAAGSSSGASFAVRSISETEVALMAAMTEEFGAAPTDLSPIEDEGDPFASRPETPAEPSDAAKRLEALLAQRLSEEYDLVESASTSTPKVVESETEPTNSIVESPDVLESTADVGDLVQSDIDAVARAEMEALEALGSELGHSRDAIEIDPATDVTESSTETIVAAIEPESSAMATAEPESTSEPIDESTSESEIDADADVTVTPRPVPMVEGPSAIVRLGSLPFRVLPATLHRHVTPVALSLAAWVPLAWGFAILGPRPAPPTVDALPAGIHAASDIDHAASSDSVTDQHDDAVHAATTPVDAHAASVSSSASVKDPVSATSAQNLGSGHATSSAGTDHGSSHDGHH